jgi:hypothetical protein
VSGGGGWWLVVGGWWLVVGGWWLVVGGWWLVLVVGGSWWWLVVVAVAKVMVVLVVIVQAVFTQSWREHDAQFSLQRTMHHDKSCTWKRRDTRGSGWPVRCSLPCPPASTLQYANGWFECRLQVILGSEVEAPVRSIALQ